MKEGEYPTTCIAHCWEVTFTRLVVVLLILLLVLPLIKIVYTFPIVFTASYVCGVRYSSYLIIANDVHLWVNYSTQSIISTSIEASSKNHADG